MTRQPMTGRQRLAALENLRELAAEQARRDEKLAGFVHPLDAASLALVDELIVGHRLRVAKAIIRQGIARDVAAENPGWSESQVQYEARVQLAAMPSGELAARAAQL